MQKPNFGPDAALSYVHCFTHNSSVLSSYQDSDVSRENSGICNELKIQVVSVSPSLSLPLGSRECSML